MLVHLHGSLWAALGVIGCIADLSQILYPFSVSLLLHYVGFSDLWAIFLVFTLYMSAAKLCFVLINRLFEQNHDD